MVDQYPCSTKKSSNSIKRHGYLEHLEGLNSIQPLYVPKYTDMGFEKIKLSDEVFDKIKNTWNSEFEWPLSDEFKEIELDVIHNINNKIKTKSYLIANHVLNSYLHDNLKHILEDWSGEELQLTSVYGVRVYPDGSMLKRHVDKYQTHIISAIINVDQKVNAPWPLQIYDDYGILHEVFLEPGEMCMYESARVVHGREKPLNGDYFANIFILKTLLFIKIFFMIIFKIFNIKLITKFKIKDLNTHQNH